MLGQFMSGFESLSHVRSGLGMLGDVTPCLSSLVHDRSFRPG